MVDVGRVQHLQKVVIVDAVFQLLGNILELLEVNHSVIILVVESEHSLQTVPGLSLTHSGSNGIKELIKVDGFVLLPNANDEAQDEGVSLVEAELFKDLVDLCGVDGSTAVLIKDVERLLELFVVLSMEAVFPGSGGGFGGLG